MEPSAQGSMLSPEILVRGSKGGGSTTLLDAQLSASSTSRHDMTEHLARMTEQLSALQVQFSAQARVRVDQAHFLMGRPRMHFKNRDPRFRRILLPPHMPRICRVLA